LSEAQLLRGWGYDEDGEQFPAEMRVRLVRTVLDEAAHPSRWAAIMSIAGRIGCTAQTLNAR